MPEGDTIHHAANRIRPILQGRAPDEILTPHPRFRADRWPERLAGRTVEAVEARGKHLLIRWEGDLVLRAAGHEIVQFDGPVLELMTASRVRFDQRIAALGPDILGPQWGDAEEARFLRRLREDDPTRPVGDALLDQRTVAGLGTIWRTEGCFLAHLSPWRPTGEVGDDEALAVVRAVRPLMQDSALEGFQERFKAIYDHEGRPCPRCGGPIRRGGIWEDNRPAYWCDGCQS